MALTDDNGTGLVMPVAPMYGGSGNSNNSGWGSDGWETNLPSLNRGIKREG